VLFVNPGGRPSSWPSQLEAMGFRVTEAREWPDDERVVLEHQVVIVRVHAIDGAPMLAARLRAKPRFGRRVLIALVAPATSVVDRLSARTSGFDEVLFDCCAVRLLTARILRRLRNRPEYHCVLPPGDRRRRAA
jgi:DNA-binding response OmpR family regulator